MRNLERKLTGLALGTALVLGAGCNPDATSPRQPALSKAQADSLAAAVMSDMEDVLEGAAISNADFLLFPSAPIQLDDRPAVSCSPAHSPASPANSDGDPVPDSVRFDFAGCVISTPRATITYSGTIDILDPTPSETDHAVKAKYTNFKRSETRLLSGATTSVEQNGVRQFIRNSSVVQHSETNFRTVITFPDGSTASHVKNWSSTFTADVAGSIVRGPLPSGTWSINGSSTWTRGERSYSLTVTTNPPLHYNASCTVAPKFDAGKLTAVVTRGTTSSTVTIEFTACGQYTVTRT